MLHIHVELVDLGPVHVVPKRHTCLACSVDIWRQNPGHRVRPFSRYFNVDVVSLGKQQIFVS